ncbi:Di-sulfide bridge nucleocytoplasmic transport domain-containing protein [Xylariales sp. AK1849]|nr:Di-sulfide bridge nucleocytoplasmic transport domain-containing protein [Xylariales sp. AK1849]
MERRTYESPMEWEYQNQGPMDPTSPFVQSAQNARQNNNAFGLPRTGTFGQQNAFSRTQTSPHKPLPPTPGGGQYSSIFSSSNQPFQRTSTAPPFRNPAFTTPRKPYDMDPLSEVSAAEDSPAATDVSESCPDTPETDNRDRNSRSFSQMTLTPARSKLLGAAASTKTAGKGGIPRGGSAFGGRDKVRKRKRKHGDKDISGFRLPYKYQEEWDDSDNGADSDDSTYQPNEHHSPQDKRVNRGKKGWFSGFLSAIQKHPSAPILLGYWIQLLFNLVIVGMVLWVLWVIVAGFRDDFWAARQEGRAEIVEEMAKCAHDYTQNRCAPREQRLPAMNAMCDEWELCMNQDPDRVRRVKLGAKNIVEIINEIFESMHWKTMAAFFLLFTMLCFSGASLFRSTPTNFTSIPSHPPPPQYSQPAIQQHPHFSYPQTPSNRHYGFLQDNEDTPDTDASPSDMKTLPAPYMTPSGRRSPSKEERQRGRSASPTKNRSPRKGW